MTVPELAARTVALIEANEGHFDKDTWVTEIGPDSALMSDTGVTADNVCNTTLCGAGWLEVAAGNAIRLHSFRPGNNLAPLQAAPTDPETFEPLAVVTLAPGDYTYVDWRGHASELLDVTPTVGGMLFLETDETGILDAFRAIARGEDAEAAIREAYRQTGIRREAEWDLQDAERARRIAERREANNA